MANEFEPSGDSRRGGRAGADRRTKELPIVHAERRSSERRSGGDRRSSPRI